MRDEYSKIKHKKKIILKTFGKKINELIKFLTHKLIHDLSYTGLKSKV